jgi:heavy metal efflux system protein
MDEPSGAALTLLMRPTTCPMAMVGGVFALLLTGAPFSVSAAIGFIALFGIAVMEGIILLSYFNQLVEADEGRRVRASMPRSAKSHF